MLKARAIAPRGAWSGEAAGAVELDFDARHRRRLVMTATNGLRFLLDLPRAARLRGGDALTLNDGRLIEIVAAREPLAEICVADRRDFARLAYHLGNRHLSVEVHEDRVRIRRDAVIEDMARGLGANVAHIEAAFDPEDGAYAHADAHDDAGVRDVHGVYDDDLARA